MYVYILRCTDNSLYTGITVDIIKRLKQHSGLLKGGAKYTRSHPPVSVEALWYTDSENCARKLECSLKKLKHTQKEEIISDPENNLTKYYPHFQELKYIGTSELKLETL